MHNHNHEGGQLTPLSDFPDYAVREDGTVWSYKTGKWKKLKPRPVVPSRKGNLPYHRVVLYKDEKRYDLPVHQLVLETFVGPRPAGAQGCHNDGDPANNRLSNLRWDTPENNQQDRLVHGTHMRGEQGRAAAVSDELAIRIREEYGPPRGRGKRGSPTLKELAAKYGLNINTVASIAIGRTYNVL